MARWTLVIRPDGKALLTCQDRIPDSHLAQITAAVGEWKAAIDAPVLVIAECDVVQVVDMEFDLGGELVTSDR